MARLWYSGWEQNSVTDGVEFTTNTAPVSIVTTNPRSGTYHGRVTAGAGFWRQIIFTSNQTTTGYICVGVLIHAAVNASTQLVRWSNAANTSVGNITLKTDNTLVLLKSDGTQIGSASAALTTDTWYYVELKNDASTSPGALEGRLNGVAFATGSNSNQGQWARALVGCVTGAQTTNDIYFDDWAINDSSGASQTAYPNGGKLIALRPDSAGDVNGFAVGFGGTPGAANNFGRVNEVPPDDATTYNGSSAVNQEDLFNCGASGINSYDVVNVVSVGIRLADNAVGDATSAVKAEIEKTASSTISQGLAIIPNSATFMTNAAADPRNYSLVTYVDPTGGAWTQTTLDSMQIGYKATAFGTVGVNVTNVWALVDYSIGTPPAASTGATLLMMGV